MPSVIDVDHENDLDIVAEEEKAYTIASSATMKHNSMSMKHQQIRHIKSKPQRHIINANNNTISSANSLYDYIISSKKESNTKSCPRVSIQLLVPLLMTQISTSLPTRLI